MNLSQAAVAFLPQEQLAYRCCPMSSTTPAMARMISRICCGSGTMHVRLQQEEGGDLRILLAAVLLHDCVRVEKDSPLRSQASTLSAQRAREILDAQGWTQDAERVAHAVQAHSYSAQVTPQSLEAKIVQDADRLDAIGAMAWRAVSMWRGGWGGAL
jgi:uncharacterized protein